MQMIMPNVLVASRFVVLAGGDAVTGVNFFEGNGHTFGKSVNAVGNVKWKFVDVFEVLGGHN